MNIVDAGKRIVIEQILIRIDRIIPQAKAFLQIHIHKSIKGNAKLLLELFLNIPLLTVALGNFRSVEQRGQQRKLRTLATVIAPHGEEYILNIVFPAHAQGSRRCLDTKLIIRGKTDPGPQTACKPSVVLNLRVGLHHAVITLLVPRIIIPVYQLHIIGNLCPNFFIDLGRLIIFAHHQLEEHIRPHAQREIILLGNLTDLLNMLNQNLGLVPITVFVVILTAADHLRLIHTYVNNLGRQTRR